MQQIREFITDFFVRRCNPTLDRNKMMMLELMVMDSLHPRRTYRKNMKVPFSNSFCFDEEMKNIATFIYINSNGFMGRSKTVHFGRTFICSVDGEREEEATGYERVFVLDIDLEEGRHLIDDKDRDMWRSFVEHVMRIIVKHTFLSTDHSYDAHVWQTGGKGYHIFFKGLNTDMITDHIKLYNELMQYDGWDHEDHTQLIEGVDFKVFKDSHMIAFPGRFHRKTQKKSIRIGIF